MLDAVTGVGVGMRLLRGVDRVEDHVDRGRRLRVCRSLQADGVRLRDQRRIVGGLVIELSGPARVAHVPVREIRGPAAESAVGVELDPAERET